MAKKDMLGEVVRKLVDFSPENLGIIYDLLEKCNGNLNGDDWLKATKEFLRQKPPATNPFLRRINNEPLIINAVSGKKILANATDVFTAIDANFRNWGADEPGLPTGKTEAAIYEIVKDGTTKELLGSLGGDIEKLCFTQSQIGNFAEKNRSWLRTDGYGTFFLFRSKGKYFFTRVGVYSANTNLSVGVYRFKFSEVWSAGIGRQLVFPQLD